MTDAQRSTWNKALKIRCGSCRPGRVLADVWVSERGSLHISGRVVSGHRESLVPTYTGLDQREELIGDPWTGRLGFPCHRKKCGAWPVVRKEKLYRAVYEALGEGRTEIWLR